MKLPANAQTNELVFRADCGRDLCLLKVPPTIKTTRDTRDFFFPLQQQSLKRVFLSNANN